MDLLTYRKCVSGNILDDTPKHLLEDIGDFNLWNITAGPLVVTLKGSIQFEVKKYLTCCRDF